MLRGIVGGIFGGLLGAAAWTVATALSGTQLGLGLWLVGLLTGVGVALGLRREGCARAGFAAVLVALCAVGAGKAAGSPFIQPDSSLSGDHAVVTEADAVTQLERDIRREWAEQGRVGVLAEGREVPQEVRSEAMRQWAQMSDARRALFIGAIAESRAPKATPSFFGTLTLLDALWFLLALATAFKVAAYAQPSTRSRAEAKPEKPSSTQVCDDLSSAAWGKRISPAGDARMRKAA